MKILSAIICSLLLITPLEAKTAKEAFASMPESMLWDLNVNSRLDLIDLFEAGRESVVLNSFEDSVSLEKLTPDYLLLKSGQSSIQIIVLTMLNESFLYCFIQTVCSPLCDSRIEFYTPSWKPLDSKTFISSATKEWFIPDNEISPTMNISFMQFVYNPENSFLLQLYNTPKNRSADDPIEHSFPVKEKKYTWNGIRFE
jgi:hypothetical protein